MRAIITILLLAICLGLNAKTFLREYTYRAGEADSKITARAIALEQVKRLLLEEVGVYIQSSIQNQETEIDGKMSSLTQTDIQVLTAGITKTKVISETWNGESYWMKAEIELDEKDVLKKLDDLINNEQNKQAMEDSRQITDNALAEIERLRLALEQEKDKNAKSELQKAYIAETEKLSAVEWDEKGSKAYSDSDYPLAVTYLSKSVELDPNNRNVWFTLGLANNLNKDNGQAIKCFTKCLELDSLFVDAVICMGNVYEDMDEFEKAIQYYQKAMQMEPTNIRPLIYLGSVYNQQAQYELAIDIYKLMLSLDDDKLYSANRLAEVYIALEDFPNAIKYYQMVVALDSTSLSNWMNLGDAYNGSKDYQKAIQAYLKALNIEPDNIWTLNSIGKAYYDLGEPENGNKYYIKSAQFGDEDIQNWCDSNGIIWKL